MVLSWVEAGGVAGCGGRGGAAVWKRWIVLAGPCHANASCKQRDRHQHFPPRQQEGHFGQGYQPMSSEEDALRPVAQYH